MFNLIGLRALTIKFRNTNTQKKKKREDIFKLILKLK